MFLTPDQIRELTDRETKPAQCARLQKMKIPYLYEPPGEIKVLAAHVERRVTQRAQGKYATEPDFSVFPTVG